MELYVIKIHKIQEIQQPKNFRHSQETFVIDGTFTFQRAAVHVIASFQFFFDSPAAEYIYT